MQHLIATQDHLTWTALPEANKENSISSEFNSDSLLTSPGPMPIPQSQPSASTSSMPIRLTYSEPTERSMIYVRRSNHDMIDPNAHAVQPLTSVRTRSPIASVTNLDADSVTTGFGPLSADAPSNLGFPTRREPYVLLQPITRSTARPSLDGERSSTGERGTSAHSLSLSARPNFTEQAADKDEAAGNDLASVINTAVANNTNGRGKAGGPVAPVGPTQVDHPASARDGKTGAESISLQPISAEIEGACSHRYPATPH